jgi:hypothetical protein
MNANYLCLYCVLILSANTLSAQNNFVKATIIKNDKDTVQGFIKYGNWYTDPATIVNRTLYTFAFLNH